MRAQGPSLPGARDFSPVSGFRYLFTLGHVFGFRL